MVLGRAIWSSSSRCHPGGQGSRSEAGQELCCAQACIYHLLDINTQTVRSKQRFP